MESLSLSEITEKADRVFTAYQKEIDSIDVKYADKHKKEKMAEINARHKDNVWKAQIELEDAIKRSEAARSQLADPVFDTCRRALSLAKDKPELTQAVCQAIPDLPFSAIEHIALSNQKNAVISLAVLARIEAMKSSQIDDDRKTAFALQQKFEATLPIQNNSIVLNCHEEIRALRVLHKRAKQPTDTLTLGHKENALMSEIQKYQTEGMLS